MMLIWVGRVQRYRDSSLTQRTELNICKCPNKCQGPQIADDLHLGLYVVFVLVQTVMVIERCLLRDHTSSLWIIIY